MNTTNSPGVNAPIRVLIVDDAALVRQMLSKMLSADPAIEVVGTAPDPFVAREKIKKLRPDVLTLDVEMPKMDGITFLRNLMRLRPMPVVMVSTLTEKGAQVTLEALELGAIDFVAKPKMDLAHSLDASAEEIVSKVKTAAMARPRAAPTTKPSAAGSVQRVSAAVRMRTTERIIAIGASTGGTEAIKEVLLRLPADGPGIVITQHIPPKFSATFAQRMHETCPMNVCEAEHGQQILPGHAYIAPGGRHLALTRDGARYVCEVHDGDPVNRHRPSVDVLFNSVAKYARANAVAAILTGMGDDGARGMKAMLEAGAATMAQDEASSVVWGMPGAAVKLGATDEVLPLEAIAERLLSLALR